MFNIVPLSLPDIRHHLSQSSDQPKYLKLVGMHSLNIVIVSPATGYLHGDLLLALRNHVEQTTLRRLEFEADDVFDGYVEVGDGSIAVRDMQGVRLPSNFVVAIENALKRWSET